ncbi:MAG: ankyrin repeat domain-containing protein, partial [Elusimicrobiota bacterium]|nr:ankyrin repeat domain-containing protein [Elusimicrobiota bacterium]
MKTPDIKQIFIGLALLLPILTLLFYTIRGMDNGDGNRSPRNYARLKLVTPTDTADELSRIIAQDDFETAVIKINEELKDPNVPDAAGIPLLVLAAQKNNAELVSLLLERGASPNFGEVGSGETALMKAARHGNVEIINMLLFANADLNAVSKRGVTPLTSAVANGSQALVDFLLTRGARAGASEANLFNYAFAKNFIGVNAMLRNGVSPNITDAGGNTPLI